MFNFLKTTSVSQLFRGTWQKFNKFPKGNVIFSKLVGFLIPYTGSVSPIVLAVENGHSKVMLKDKRAVRNHLKSIHAIALANLGEFTTGLALIPQLNDKSQAILVNLQVDYLKKARGTLTSEALATLPAEKSGDQNYAIIANIKNELGELVCTVTATWRVRWAM